MHTQEHSDMRTRIGQNGNRGMSETHVGPESGEERVGFTRRQISTVERAAWASNLPLDQTTQTVLCESGHANIVSGDEKTLEVDKGMLVASVRLRRDIGEEQVVPRCGSFPGGARVWVDVASGGRDV